VSEDKKNIAPNIIALFRNELETHSSVLDRGLIELENEQTPTKVEPLMRAAHSIKGASRIVRINSSVELAHAMEDVLSLTMRGELTLNSNSIDILLSANDIFLTIAADSNSDIYDAFDSKVDEINSIVSSLRQIVSGESPADGKTKNIEEKEYLIVSDSSSEISQHKEDDKLSYSDKAFLRVNTEQMNVILGLAGETLIQTKTIKNLSENINRIKFLLRELQRPTIRRSNSKIKDDKKYNKKTIELVAEIQSLINEHSLNLEQLDMKFESLSQKLYYESVSTRMRPFIEGTQSYFRLVRDIAKDLDKKVKFEISGEMTKVDRDILEKLDAPLNHLIRNSIDHGIETPAERVRAGKQEYGKILLDARHRSGMLIVSVSDDGKGIDAENIRKKIIERKMVEPEIAKDLTEVELMDFLFLPGFTTSNSVTEISGRGVGLDVVFSMVQEVGGTIRIEAHPGEGTTFTLQLPVTLSLIRALVINIQGEPYAIPLTKIDRLLKLQTEEIEKINNKEFFNYNNENIGLVDASSILGLEQPGTMPESYSIVLVSDKLSKYGIIVDEFLYERNIVVNPLLQRLGKVPNIYAASVLDDGRPVLILDVRDMVRTTDNLVKGKIKIKPESQKEIEDLRKKILIVEDSATVAESMRMILDQAGFNAFVAIDGMDGWNLLEREKFDLIITDIDMPRMNGIELVTKIKSTDTTKDTPVIVESYKDRDEDREAMEKAGADMFMSKSSMNNQELITLVKMLI
jgi:two-component system sensor histidine kinase and response regulator WspE